MCLTLIAVMQGPERYGKADSSLVWSIYRGNTGLADNKLLSPHVEYLALASESASRYAAYRAVFEMEEDPALVKAIRAATHGGYALVGESLKSQLAQRAERPLERRKPGPQPAAISAPDSITRDLGL